MMTHACDPTSAVAEAERSEVPSQNRTRKSKFLQPAVSRPDSYNLNPHFNENKTTKPDMESHDFNPRIWEIETGSEAS